MTTWIASDRPRATNHALIIWMTLFFTLFSWAVGYLSSTPSERNQPPSKEPSASAT
jgi:hypothetical protein